MAHRTISEQLKAAIKHSGQTRYAIAKGSGVSEGQLSRFMTGQKGLSLSTVDRLAAYLDLVLIQRQERKRR